MSFVQCDDMVQNLSATTSSPAFRGSILPGRLNSNGSIETDAAPTIAFIAQESWAASLPIRVLAFFSYVQIIAGRTGLWTRCPVNS